MESNPTNPRATGLRVSRQRGPWALVACALACSFNSDAWAQRARHHRHAAQGAREARALFAEGVAFADRQRWAEALDAFQRSLAIAPQPGARFGVAQALLHLGRFGDAVAAFEAHLAAPDDDAARVAQSRTLVAEARSQLVPAAPAPRAAPTPTPMPTLTQAEARAAFDLGREALLARRYDQAAEAFQEAARLEPSPGTWRWLGVTLRSIGRYTESIAALDRYLAAPEADATAEHLAEMRLAQAEMRRALGRLVFTVSPPHTVLLVDARPRPIGATEVVLDPGGHVVELRADGYRSVRQEVDLRPGGQVVLNLRLEADTAPAAPAAGSGAGPWAVVGVGGALALSAAVLYGLRGAALQDVNAACDEITGNCLPLHDVQARVDYEAAQRYELAAGVLLGFGTAAVAGGLLWRFLVRPSAAPRRQAWRMGVTPSANGAMITVGGEL